MLYEVGKRHGFAELRAWFGCLYQVLLGQQEGPRFGGFVALYGIAETIALIEAALTGPNAATAGLTARGPTGCSVTGLKNYLRHLPALLGVCLLVGAIYVVQREFRNLKLDDISAALEDDPGALRLARVPLDVLLVFRAHLLRPPRHHLCRAQGLLLRGPPSPRSAPTRCRTISVSPRFRARRCATGCTRIGA